MIKVLISSLEDNKFISKYLRKNKEHIVKGIIKNMRIRRLREGDLLFKKGDPANHFLCLLKGSVNIYTVRDEAALQKEIGQKIREMY